WLGAAASRRRRRDQNGLHPAGRRHAESGARRQIEGRGALGEDARSRDVPALPAGRELAGAFLQDQHRLLVRLVEAGGLSTVEHETPAGQLTRMRRSPALRSEEHTSELQSRSDLVCRLLLEKKKNKKKNKIKNYKHNNKYFQQIKPITYYLPHY